MFEISFGFSDSDFQMTDELRQQLVKNHGRTEFIQHGVEFVFPNPENILENLLDFIQNTFGSLEFRFVIKCITLSADGIIGHGLEPEGASIRLAATSATPECKLAEIWQTSKKGKSFFMVMIDEPDYFEPVVKDFAKRAKLFYRALRTSGKIVDARTEYDKHNNVPGGNRLLRIAELELQMLLEDSLLTGTEL